MIIPKKVLGIVSIILGMGLIVFSWRYLFMSLGYMLWGDIEHMLKGLTAILIYILATGGFIISGIGMIKQKKWALVLFVLLIILWVAYLISLSIAASSVQTWEDRHKQLEEKAQRELQELHRQREYLRLQQER